MSITAVQTALPAAVASGCNTLPDEILSLVFEILAQMPGGYRDVASCARVSKRFHQLAGIGNKHFWEKISVHEGFKTVDAFKKYCVEHVKFDPTNRVRCHDFFRVSQEQTTCLIRSLDGRYIVTGSFGGTIRVWDMWRVCCCKEFKQPGKIIKLTLSADGKYLCCYSALYQPHRRFCHVWNLRNGSSTNYSDRNPEYEVLTGGKYIFYNCSSNEIEIHDLTNPALAPICLAPQRRPQYVGDFPKMELSEEGKHLVFISCNGIDIWDVEAESRIVTFPKVFAAADLVFFVKGKSLVSINGADINVLDIKSATDKKLPPLLRPADHHFPYVFTEQYFIFTRAEEENYTINVYNMDTGLTTSIDAGTSKIDHMAYSSARECIVCGHTDTSVKVWDINGNRQTWINKKGYSINRLKGPSVIAGLHLSPDGNYLSVIYYCARSPNGMCRLWNLEDGSHLPLDIKYPKRGSLLLEPEQNKNSFPSHFFIVENRKDTVTAWMQV